MAAAAATLSTTENLVESTSAGARWGRRVTLLALVALVALALVGALGVHTSQISAQGNGYTLTLRYPSNARAGLDTQWQVRVEHPGGFDKEIVLTVSGSYFDLFEAQAMWPEPSAATRDGEDIEFTFDAPPGDTFVVDFDAYIQPASQRGRTAHLGVVVDDVEQVGLDYTTKLVP